MSLTRQLLLPALAMGLLAHAVRAADAPAQVPAAPAEAHGGDVVEPEDYRQEDYRKPVPKTLKGAKAVSTEEAERLFGTGTAAFIDVYPRAPKPPNLPAGTIWRDPPHTTIKGAEWLPNVGYGKLTPEDVVYFKGHLERISGGDKAKTLVFYCLRDCWMSWNAAKRAMADYAYTNVVWFPDGTDGWQEAGNEVASVRPAQ